ncbi:type II toxin-antitoxin system VapB family antitoxin [Shinella curvata]|uniref:Type II toxin-antitoxin system VapB family antitoxin n=1 Tax=Shinella curvata TaxID=1817964 RepID=A0ABT8XG23_9HYPH|nr:type II toxin-antitoxin system VapB family antitoxin [Shinella curvata]MCJ8052865.1 type II toxin-antitoxin system VapB family antitoxin [Shinella curvata]MDO6122196.1 type II toxin-antitoxin system VapB family antitoxin [Shinella curvata]
MALFIRDDEVDALAAQLQKAMNAPTKKEAVRRALRNELDREKHKASLRERLAPLQERVATWGKPDPNFDMKKFTDEMWDDL